MSRSNRVSDLSTSDMREGRRRLIIRVAATGLIARAAAFLPVLGMAPIAAAKLGTERFGVLMTALSLVAFLSVADLGVGGSLVTQISRALGARDFRRISSLQTNGFAVALFMSLMLLCCGIVLIYLNVGVFAFPGSSAVVQKEATATFSTFIIMFALSLPFTLIFKAQLGMQFGEIANRWQTVGAITNFIFGVIACQLGFGLPYIVAGLLSGTVLCGLLNSFFHFRKKSDYQPNFKSFDLSVIQNLLKDSSFYFALQLIFMATFALDTLLVARQFGAETVSSYALSERLFSLVAVAVSIFTAPLWAAYGEALGSKDYEWVRSSLKTSIVKILLFSTFLSVSLFCLFEPLIKLFGSQTVTVSYSIAAAMAMWRIIESLGSTLAAYLMAAQAIKFLLLTGTITAVVSLLSKILAISYFGPVSLPLITMISCIACSLVPCLIYIRSFNRKMLSLDNLGKN